MTAIHPKQKLNFSINIAASRERIWDTLTGDKSYREWTAAFCSGSHFVGDWSEGSIMRFLGPGEDGTEGGMISRVIEHKPGAVIRAEMIGVIADGKDVFSGEEFDKWVPMTESYRLTADGDTCLLSVEQDIAESCVAFFSEGWQKALATIKKIAERQPTVA